MVSPAENIWEPLLYIIASECSLLYYQGKANLGEKKTATFVQSLFIACKSSHFCLSWRILVKLIMLHLVTVSGFCWQCHFRVGKSLHVPFGDFGQRATKKRPLLYPLLEPTAQIFTILPLPLSHSQSPPLLHIIYKGSKFWRNMKLTAHRALRNVCGCYRIGMPKNWMQNVVNW